MHKLVHEDQQCPVKGHKIQNHLPNIREIITYCNAKETPARILSLDQEKAFDRVSHSFLHKVLEASNLRSVSGIGFELYTTNPVVKTKVLGIPIPEEEVLSAMAKLDNNIKAISKRFLKLIKKSKQL
ncbi:hypothetical protein RRG08_027730 [Elysia crispata]|uniref:Reverse transcriptase domain-containing protein n=1 Tax=Elysia crispata TaxID=231223 RepID=A0AAE0YBF0_9GAST|nr:hypothetical protein RRG08_027730 [Elysia crispata]